MQRSFRTLRLKPSLVNAGFVVLEVFDSESEEALSSSLTKLLQIPPENRPTNLQVVSWPPRPMAKSTNWRPNNQSLTTILSEGAKRFNVDISDCMSHCQSVRFSIVTPSAVPFILLVVHVSLDPTKLGLADARERIQRVAIPFRLFVEKLNGLSAQGASWSPRVASISWASVKVEQSFLNNTAANVLQLETSCEWISYCRPRKRVNKCDPQRTAIKLGRSRLSDQLIHHDGGESTRPHGTIEPTWFWPSADTMPGMASSR